MWEFNGIIGYTCNKCSDRGEIPIEDFSIECTGGSERGMGAESIYEVLYEFECDQCNSDISLSFEVSEYPVEVLNFVINNSSGATTEDEPEFEYLREIYSAEDLFYLHESVSELIIALRSSPYLLGELDPRQFEEIVAEVFRFKGYQVDLTKRTRDGGKDIIAIHTDSLGIKNKYFIECKCYAESNKIGVDIVRSLYGVKNTKEGPNKAILVTTSTFTSGAKKFLENEAASSWELTLADREQLLKWLDDYNES